MPALRAPQREVPQAQQLEVQRAPQPEVPPPEVPPVLRAVLRAMRPGQPAPLRGAGEPAQVVVVEAPGFAGYPASSAVVGRPSTPSCTCRSAGS